jgi:hypothetical protein
MQRCSTMRYALFAIGLVGISNSNTTRRDPQRRNI